MIAEQAKHLGHRHAVKLVLKLPDFPEEDLKYYARRHFNELPVGYGSGNLVEKSWIMAYSSLMPGTTFVFSD